MRERSVLATIPEDSWGNSDVATVTVNYPPVANDDNATGATNEVINVEVLKNDINTSKPFDPLSVVIVDAGASNGGKELVVPGEGTWVVEDNGTITFYPVQDFSGHTTPIHYTVSEENSEGLVDTSNIAEVVINYPAAIDDILNTTDAPGTPQSVPVLDNDGQCIDALVVIIDPETNTTTDILVVEGERK